MTKIRNTRLLIGSIIRIRKTLGTAPIIGPKYGITFVMPTITLTSSTNGSFKIVIPRKHSTPIIAESRIFPTINPRNISFASRVMEKIRFARSGLNSAHTHFFDSATSRSLDASR